MAVDGKHWPTKRLLGPGPRLWTFEPGRRRWKSPYGRVLDVSRRIGQFDLTEEEILMRYTKPRLLGYAQTMGVDVRVSDWSDDGMITLELAD